MAEDKERFRRALDFMKTLGVPNAVVIPILRRLVKLYENEWSLIEEENYRALADSYFDQLESKEANAPVRVTRNSSRRCALTEIRGTEVPAKEPGSLHKKPSRRVTFSAVSAASESTSIDHVENKEKQAQVETDVSRAASAAARQDIACSYLPELQLECLRYKERVPTDLVHSQGGCVKKPRIDAGASSSTTRNPELDVLLATPLLTEVKEEPLEFPLVVQKREAAVQHPAPLPAAIMSTRTQEKQIVIFDKEHANKVQDNGSEDSLRRQRPRRKLALLAHSSERSVSRQENESLLSIAATYGNMSDDESGASEKNISMKSMVNMQHTANKQVSSAERTSTVSSNDFVSKGKEASSKPTLSSNGLSSKRRESGSKPMVSCNVIILKGKETNTEPEVPCNDFILKGREASSKPGTCNDLIVKERNMNSKPAEPYKDLLTKSRGRSSKAAVAVKEEPICTYNSDGHSNAYTLNHDDISRGQEVFPISVLNSMTDQSLPPSFCYIKNSITFQDAYVNFALARIGEDDCCAKCLGNCLERYPPCHCARETGGEFAYGPDGRLRTVLLREAIADRRDTESSSSRNKFCEKGSCFVNSEHCKGHLIRKFVKECWSKCGCDMQCGNRVVQKGIRKKLQVSYISKGKGWGLRTLEDLLPGTFVCEYVGEILTNVELDKRNAARKGHTDHYPTLLDADLSSETMLRDEDLLCLDATYYGNVARFINHRCYDANLVDIPVEIESPDHHYYHIAFFTTRLVRALEELTWDYCIDFEDVMHPIKAFRCLCESEYCRGRHYEP